MIENRGGASSNIATGFVARANPDGYTLLLISAGNAWNTAIYDNLKFDFIRDIAPVASLERGGGVMVVNPSVPVKTVSEFISYVKANRAGLRGERLDWDRNPRAYAAADYRNPQQRS